MITPVYLIEAHVNHMRGEFQREVARVSAANEAQFGRPDVTSRANHMRPRLTALVERGSDLSKLLFTSRVLRRSTT